MSHHLHTRIAQGLNHHQDDTDQSSRLQAALYEAFNATNREYLELAATSGSLDGTTATIAMVQPGKMTLANLGDSAAVLLTRDAPTRPAGISQEVEIRHGSPPPTRGLGRLQGLKLTHNHNPSCPIERRRIEATRHDGIQGFVTTDGVHRVQDMLSVSRAIGNRLLAPFLSDVPDLFEVLALTLTLSDVPDLFEVITFSDAPDPFEVGLNGSTVAGILASDGLWDVVTPTEVQWTCAAGLKSMQICVDPYTGALCLIHARQLEPGSFPPVPKSKPNPHWTRS